MKIKTTVVLVAVMVSFGCGVVWGQNNAGGVSYYGPHAAENAAAARAQQQAAALRAQQQAAAMRTQQAATLNKQQEEKEKQTIIDGVYSHYPQPIDKTADGRPTGRYRILDGQLYSVYSEFASTRFEWVPPDPTWYKLKEIIAIDTNRILCSVYGDKAMSDASRTLGIRPMFPEDAEKNQVLIKEIIILNSEGLIEGRTLNTKAVRIDNTLYNRVSYETYDCGLPDTIENRKKAGIAVPTPEQEDAAKKEIEAVLKEREERKIAAYDAAKMVIQDKKEAGQARDLKWNQEQAAKGDSFGLLRMGERYRDGHGVPKDLSKAREYLTKAAAAGSPTATAALSRLNQVSTKPPATR